MRFQIICWRCSYNINAQKCGILECTSPNTINVNNIGLNQKGKLESEIQVVNLKGAQNHIHKIQLQV